MIGWAIKLLYIVCWFHAALQMCQEPIPANEVEVLETYQAGHIIFVMDTSPSKTVWSLVLLDSQMPASKFSLPRYFQISSVNSSNTYWQVRLNQTIDVENIFHLTGVVIHSIDVKLSCFDTTTQQYANYSRSIKVKHVSEFPPRFEPNIKLHIAENANIGQPLADLRMYVSDADVTENSEQKDIHKCRQNQYTGQGASGHNIIVPNGDCLILLEVPVDYERGPRQYYINVTVQDNGGLEATAIIQIIIDNEDDGPPVFVCDHSCNGCGNGHYAAFITSLTTGIIRNMLPNKMSAVDPDQGVVQYTIISSTPVESTSHVTINYTTGEFNIVIPFSDLTISTAIFFIEIRNEPVSLQSNMFKTSQFSVATIALIISPHETVIRKELGSYEASIPEATTSLFIVMAVLLSALIASALAFTGFLLQLKHPQKIFSE
ncbi:uncharacterized protein LOC106078388 isoform X1 [Biomphalaria glabrata]|uniref:Uncharacterized protein LOC106078388 isoform X1 n=2 Tax=Biomphalaria glabrata TaxID=6526 RepID=A0A9W2ZSY6_BIOGL|nr:uncharacterized protein LOC106078388 isoform X1 [Biomphalaria glabrata]